MQQSLVKFWQLGELKGQNFLQNCEAKLRILVGWCWKGGMTQTKTSLWGKYAHFLDFTWSSDVYKVAP